MQLLQGFTMKRKILTGILGLVLAAVTAVSWSLTARHVAGQDETSSKTPPSPPPVELKELPIDPKDLEAVKAFEQDYEPASGQAVRRIEPPFPASRLAYYRIHHNIQSQHMPSGPGTMTVVWTKDQHATKAMWFGEPQTGETLRRLVPSLFQISPQYLRGDDQWLSRQIPGDFSVRAEASREQIAAGLAEILSEALGTPITLKFEERETEVYVARGEFQLSALAKQRGFVLLDRAQIGTITSIEDGNPALCPRAYFPDFLDYVGHCCLTPIVSEVKQTPEGRIWFHSMLPPKAELDKLQWVNGAFPIPPEPMFKGLTEQTGLSFTKEQRKLPTVTVQASN